VSERTGVVRRRFAELLLVAGLLAVAGLTLFPTPVPPGLSARKFVVLGSLADLLRNIALFLPIGVALALRGAGSRTAWLGSLALAAVIEIAQIAIPGRSTSPDDALANALGAGLGHALVRAAPAWLRPARATARRLELAAGLAFASAVALTGLLTAPALTDGPWYAHWNPLLETVVPYPGPLRAASLAGAPLAHGPIADPAGARRALESGEVLEVSLIASGRADGFEAIFLISDARDREVALLALDRDDLVFRYRSRAQALGLEAAVLRVADAWLDTVPGSPVVLSFWRAGGTVCLARDQSRFCRLAFSVGSGWRLVLPVLSFPARLEPVFDLLWLAALALPIGLWCRRDLSSALMPLLAVAALLGIPCLGWLATPTLCLALAAGAGWGIGFVLARSVYRSGFRRE
jgi:VanZ family protein